MFSLLHTTEAPVCIVYPAAVTNYAFDAADILASFIYDISHIRPVLECDTNVDPGDRKIILGETILEESSAVLGRIGYGECIIVPLGNNLVIATRTESILPQAIHALMQSLVWLNKALCFSDQIINKPFFSLGMLKRIPLFPKGKQVHCRKSLDLCDQIVIEEADRSAYDQYQRILTADQFEKTYENVICGNCFSRYKKQDCSVYVYYTPFNHTVRILAEPLSNAHIDAPSRSYNITASPLMTVIGGRFSTVSRYMNCDSGSGNMGYVFRMDDGRFILVDGGMDSGNYAENIYRTLTAQAPDPENIVIACWFLSHTHIDHIGAFLTVAEQYSKKIELQEIACNFPSMTDASVFRETWNTRRIKEHIYRYFPATKYTKVHTGEEMHFDHVRIEILYTQDDLVRQQLSLANETLNTSSICMRVYIGGNSVILPSDCDKTANMILVDMYGNYLKSDILQVCHHGGWGGTTAFYSVVDPELAIFSTSDELLPKYLQIQYNHDLVYDMHVQEVFNNAERCKTFPLPYHPSEKNLPPDPKTDLLYTEAKQLEALAELETMKNACRNLSCSNND